MARTRWRTPPGWPEPPVDWCPWPGWQPDPTWPAAPADWPFWERVPLSTLQKIGIATGVVLGIATVAATAFGFYALAHTDNGEFFDGAVQARAEVACRQLTTSLHALPPLAAGSTPAARAQRLRREAALVRDLVTSVETVGPKALADDFPSLDWLQDWESLAAARATLADEVAQGQAAAVMVEPKTSDGYPISRRLKDSGPSSCRVVDELLR